MTFSDDDLKRLKAHVDFCGKTCQGCTEMKLPEFIVRLEAAERCAILLSRTGGEFSEEVQTWRKVAGK